MSKQIASFQNEENQINNLDSKTRDQLIQEILEGYNRLIEEYKKAEYKMSSSVSFT